MAQVLHFDFDKTHIKNSAYSPVAHGNMEDQQNAIRRGVVELLEGKRIIPMYVINFPQQELHEKQHSQVELQES